MSNYVYLVLVKHGNDDKNYLFYAPFSVPPKKDEYVVVSTKYGDKLGKVVSVISAATNSEEYKFAMQAAGAKELKRVLARTVLYDYSDEDYIEGVK